MSILVCKLCSQPTDQPLYQGVCPTCVHKSLDEVQARADRVRRQLETSSRVENVKGQGFVYLASPYTSEFKYEEDAKYAMAVSATASMFKLGHLAFSPIVHCHPIRRHMLSPGDYNYWKQFNTVFIVACSAFCFVLIDGWTRSKGMMAELSVAEKLNKPIWTLCPAREPQGYTWTLNKKPTLPLNL